MGRDDERFNSSRFLLWIVGALLSLASFLGSRQISQLERDAAKGAVDVADLRSFIFRELDTLKERSIKNGIAIDSLEKFRDRNIGMEEERSKRTAEDQGTLRVLMFEFQQLAQQVAKLEGREDKRDEEKQEWRKK